MLFKNLYSNLFAGKLARDHPINYFDIGSRGGFQKDLFPIAFAVNAIGFEPESVALKRLDSRATSPWRMVKFLPFGVSGSGGYKKLYIPKDPSAASILEHNNQIGVKFAKPQFFELDRIEEIETQTLDESTKIAGVGAIDYLKLDIEGAELEVLKNSSSFTENLLALKTEVSFVEFRKGQPLANNVDAFLKTKGFVLMDFIEPANWRKEGYIIHPHTSNESPPYSRGQLMHGDYLFFRAPEALTGHPKSLVKLALISMAFGYFDNAKMILDHINVKEYIFEKYGKTSLQVVNPASLRYGKRIFLVNLFDNIRKFVPLLRYSKNLIRK